MRSIAGNVTEALSAAAELPHVGLSEALAALRWHGRLCREIDVSREDAQAILAAPAVMAGDRKENAAYALADPLSRRGLERPCEALVAWARAA